MSKLREFFELLMTPAGQMFWLFGLLIIGIVSYRNGYPKAEEVIQLTIGAILLKLGAGMK